MLCLGQRCRRRRKRTCIWAVARMEAVHYADSTAGRRLERRNSGLNMVSKTQSQRLLGARVCVRVWVRVWVRVRVRVRVRVGIRVKVSGRVRVRVRVKVRRSLRAWG